MTVATPLPFDGRVAWVVGARGAIGRSVTEALLALGATVVASSRSIESAQAPELPAAGTAPLHRLNVDVTQRSSVDAAVAAIVQHHGRVDMLVNTTSVSIFGDFLALSDDDWLTVYQSKLFGYLRTMRAVLPLMTRQGGGRIVNVSGRGGHQPTLPVHLPGMSANASVDLMTKGLANMYGGQGVRINAVAPGPVASERYAEIEATNARLAGQASHPTASAFNSAPVSGQKVTPREVADVILYLLSDAAASLNGTVLQADGGSTAGL